MSVPPALRPGPRIAVCAAVLIAFLVLAMSCVTSMNATDPQGQQRGLVLPTYEPHGYATADTPAALRQIADVGAGWVQFVPTWYQTARDSTRIQPAGKGPDDQSVRKAVALAHEQGLRVLLKPHVDVLDGTDRSKIQPADRAAWFKSYTAFVTHYAQLAGELEVDEFAVGTELASMSSDRAGWAGAIQAVRDRYSGPLVYAANYYSYPKVAFWDLVDLVGIDAYWPLSNAPTSDVTELKRNLAPIRDELATFTKRVGRRILFTEAGFTSQKGTTTAPSDGTISTQPAQDEQAAAYEALLDTFDQQAWWAGVYWWVWTDLPADPTDPPPALDYSGRGKAVETVLTERWHKKTVATHR